MITQLLFTAFAKVEGNTFTTFDGKTYQFRGRCSYVLAGDYVDGNFSIVLDYMGKQKRKLVITTTQHAVQLLPKGKVGFHINSAYDNKKHIM